MSALMVQAYGNWSDEFDLEEFYIFNSQEDFDEWVEEVRERINSGKVEFYFGTNECVEYHTVEDLLQDLEVKEVSYEELEVLLKFFPHRRFGLSGVFF